MTALAIATKTLRLDTKGRISLGKLIHSGISGFKAFWDEERNQIILQPLVEIPAHEKWVLETPGVIESLDRAFQQSQKGQLCQRGSFQKHLAED